MHSVGMPIVIVRLHVLVTRDSASRQYWHYVRKIVSNQSNMKLRENNTQISPPECNNSKMYKHLRSHDLVFLLSSSLLKLSGGIFEPNILEFLM